MNSDYFRYLFVSEFLNTFYVEVYFLFLSFVDLYAL